MAAAAADDAGGAAPDAAGGAGVVAAADAPAVGDLAAYPARDDSHTGPPVRTHC